MTRFERTLDALFRSFAGLPAPRNEVAVQRPLRVPMPDGVELDATRFYPEDMDPAHPAPILLERTPYRMPRGFAGVMERAMATLGYQVLMVQCRGTFDSGGTFDAIHQEADDGRAVYDWLEQQSWFRPAVGLFGASYLGFTQYATLSYLPDWVKFIAPALTTTDFRDVLYPGEAFGMDTAFLWARSVGTQELTGRAARRTRRLSAAVVAQVESSLPLFQADKALAGRELPWLRDWLGHAEPGDPWWKWLDFRQAIPNAPATVLVAGWHDLFIDAQLRDHSLMTEADRDVRITIGNWTHASPTAYVVAINETIRMADKLLLGRDEPQWSGARVYVTGHDQWRQLRCWPPAASASELFAAGSELSSMPPPHASTGAFRYDPADPTPSSGGGTLDGKKAGRRDNAVRESRGDVLVYSTDPLDRDRTFAGNATLHLDFEASSPYHDLFIRLCDVDRSGRSVNVADGIRRFRTFERDVDMTFHGMAHTFRAGHRIRLQISAGAHPLVARNLGAGDELDRAMTLRSVDFVIHEPARLVLPEVPLDQLGVAVEVPGANGWPRVRRAVAAVRRPVS